MQIIVKKYEHYNRAFGKYISSKKQYDEEMAKGGYVPFEQGEEMARKARERLHKPYTGLSPKAEEIIRTAGNMKDKKGNLKASSKLIDGMKELGVRFELPDWCPKHYKPEGGFNAL